MFRIFSFPYYLGGFQRKVKEIITQKKLAVLKILNILKDDSIIF